MPYKKDDLVILIHPYNKSLFGTIGKVLKVFGDSKLLRLELNKSYYPKVEEEHVKRDPSYKMQAITEYYANYDEIILLQGDNNDKDDLFS